MGITTPPPSSYYLEHKKYLLELSRTIFPVWATVETWQYKEASVEENPLSV